MFKYAEIEAAIAQVHGVPASAMKTFRSRVRNFQRIGLVPSSPGKGQKIEYTVEDVIYWALCFELVEVGLPPASIKEIVKRHAYSLITFFEGAPQSTAYYLVLAGDFLSWYLSDEKGVKLGRYTIALMQASKLKSEILDRPEFSRAILIDLNALKKKLADAIKIDWKNYKRNWDPDASPAKPQAGDRWE